MELEVRADCRPDGSVGRQSKTCNVSVETEMEMWSLGTGPPVLMSSCKELIPSSFNSSQDSETQLLEEAKRCRAELERLQVGEARAEEQSPPGEPESEVNELRRQLLGAYDELKAAEDRDYETQHKLKRSVAAAHAIAINIQLFSTFTRIIRTDTPRGSQCSCCIYVFFKRSWVEHVSVGDYTCSQPNMFTPVCSLHWLAFFFFLDVSHVIFHFLSCNCFLSLLRISLFFFPLPLQHIFPFSAACFSFSPLPSLLRKNDLCVRGVKHALRKKKGGRGGGLRSRSSIALFPVRKRFRSQREGVGILLSNITSNRDSQTFSLVTPGTKSSSLNL